MRASRQLYRRRRELHAALNAAPVAVGLRRVERTG